MPLYSKAPKCFLSLVSALSKPKTRAAARTAAQNSINESTSLPLSYACLCHTAARDHLTALVEEAAEEAAKVADSSASAMSHTASASDDDDAAEPVAT